MGLQSCESEFIRKFCGDSSINNNGVDRYNTSEIDSFIVGRFFNFLKNNTIKVVDYVVRNGFDITHVIYKDTKNEIEYELTYKEIIEKIEGCNWVIKKGGVHPFVPMQIHSSNEVYTKRRNEPFRKKI